MDDVILRPFQPGDADWVVDRHAALYAAEEGYDHSFRVLVADIVADFLRSHDPARETGWIADRAGERLGSIFVVPDAPNSDAPNSDAPNPDAPNPDAPNTAKLRLVLIEPHARGTGLADRMLTTALQFARAAGFARMRLWTHESHIAAGRLYARHGFHLVTSTPGHQFGQPVVDQIWQRDL